MLVTNISDESKYHTIIVMRTKQITLARRFPHTIFTLNNKISYDPVQNEEGYQFNIQIDAVRYKWDQKQIVVANFEFVQQIFQENSSQPLNNQFFTHFHTLKQSENVEFYLYLSSQQFLRITPLAIIGKSLLFVLEREITLLVKDQFKDMTKLLRKVPRLMDQCYHFSSQFGLLSDKHFVNDFVRGYREFSSYSKQAQDIYQHYIHPQLHQTIASLLQLPKL